MIAACALCHELVQPAPDPTVLANADAAAALAWRNLGDTMLRHLLQRHPDFAARFAAYSSIFSHWLISFVFSSSDEGFASGQQKAHDAIADLLKDSVAEELVKQMIASVQCQGLKIAC